MNDSTPLILAFLLLLLGRIASATPFVETFDQGNVGWHEHRMPDNRQFSADFDSEGEFLIGQLLDAPNLDRLYSLEVGSPDHPWQDIYGLDLTVDFKIEGQPSSDFSGFRGRVFCRQAGFLLRFGL